jgi:hypothetical protein
MKLDNYKNIKKTEWQELANKFGIKYEENSVVRYLVEKIAEKIGVDDKIVSDNELKKQVVDKINSDSEVAPVEEVKKETTKKATTKKAPVKKDVKPKSPVIAKVETAKEEVIAEAPIEEIPVVQLSRLEQLRLECEAYGIAWSEIHTEANLEQVLNGVKGAGVQPIKEMPTTIAKPNENSVSTSVDTNAPFEINSSNANEVAKAVANAPKGDPAFNPLAIPPAPVVNGGYQNSNAYLDTYKNIYLNAIRGHWRVLSIAEINEMILRDTQTFKHQVNLHPQQQNKAEIILTDGKYSVRIPSDNTNEWLDING